MLRILASRLRPVFLSNGAGEDKSLDSHTALRATVMELIEALELAQLEPQSFRARGASAFGKTSAHIDHPRTLHEVEAEPVGGEYTWRHDSEDEAAKLCRLEEEFCAEEAMQSLNRRQNEELLRLRLENEELRARRTPPAPHPAPIRRRLASTSPGPATEARRESQALSRKAGRVPARPRSPPRIDGTYPPAQASARPPARSPRPAHTPYDRGKLDVRGDAVEQAETRVAAARASQERAAAALARGRSDAWKGMPSPDLDFGRPPALPRRQPLEATGYEAARSMSPQAWRPEIRRDESGPRRDEDYW